MKKVIITNIAFQDFKGKSNGNYTFNGFRNKISGRNGSGKTTLAESLTYALFGFGLFGERIFNEPITNTGEIKKDYTQKLNLTFKVDNETYEIRKTIIKNSIKEMSINNKPYSTKRDFDNELKSILGISEEEFLTLTNPKYFNAMTSKDARQYVISLVDNVSDGEVISNFNTTHEEDKDYLFTVRKNVDNKILLDQQLEMKENEIKIVEKDIETLDIKVQGKQETLQKITKQAQVANIEELLEQKKSIEKEMQDIHFFNKQVADNNAKYKAVEYEIQLSEQKKSNALDMIKTYEKDMNYYKSKLERERKEFDEVNVKPINDKCAICGTITDKTKEQGEAHKQHELDKIEEFAKQSKKDIENCVKGIEDFGTRAIELDNEINIKRAELNKLSYETTTKSAQELQIQLNAINTTLSNQESVHVINKEIEELNTSRTQKQTLLDKLVQQQFLLKELFKSKAETIETQINSQLTNIKVKLFEIAKNGNLKDIFTITRNGIDFARMNNASQINSGVELLNFMQKQRGISLPIFIDNAESVNQLQETNSQTFELYVSEGDLNV